MGQIGGLNQGHFITVGIGTKKAVVATIDADTLDTQVSNVQVTPGRVAKFTTEIANAPPAGAVPSSPPTIESLKFDFSSTNGPTVKITGDRFTFDYNGNPPSVPHAGNNINDLEVFFKMPNQPPVPATVVERSQLVGSRGTVTVKVPQKVALGVADIIVKRPHFRLVAGQYLPDGRKFTSAKLKLDSQYLFAALGST